ncbi:DsbA family oxidoreductase [Microlunatus endophyticus]|nr:DsbA family oxidoreductase [Microlunatus endophyticus]
MSERELFAQVPGRLGIDIWSDVVCPFCYLGDTILDQALGRFPHADSIDIAYHSFLLMPDLSDTPVDLAELLSSRHGMSRDQAVAMNDSLAARGRELGLDYRFDLAQAVSTRSAHQLSHFAAQHGKQHAMVRRLFRAYFTEGLNVADHGVLAGLAAEVGLDPSAAQSALASEAYAAEVDTDIQYAGQLGITGVPFFVFGGKYAISGAQPVEAFVQTLDTAWAEIVEGAVPDPAR